MRYPCDECGEDFKVEWTQCNDTLGQNNTGHNAWGSTFSLEIWGVAWLDRFCRCDISLRWWTNSCTQSASGSHTAYFKMEVLLVWELVIRQIL